MLVSQYKFDGQARVIQYLIKCKFKSGKVIGMYKINAFPSDSLIITVPHHFGIRRTLIFYNSLRINEHNSISTILNLDMKLIFGLSRIIFTCDLHFTLIAWFLNWQFLLFNQINVCPVIYITMHNYKLYHAKIPVTYKNRKRNILMTNFLPDCLVKKIIKVSKTMTHKYYQLVVKSKLTE